MDEFFEEPIAETTNVDLKRYVKAVLKRWWLVAVVTLGIVVPWTLHLKKQPPVYEADAWITFESVAGAVPERLIQSRIMKLRSRSFAEEVTAELGLTLQLSQEENGPPLSRQDVFKKFSTSIDPVQGHYRLRFYPAGYCAFYQGSKRLDSLRVESFIDDTVSYNGLHFSLRQDIVRDRSEVAFAIGNFRGTVQSLNARVRIYPNRAGNMLRVVMSSTDPVIASKTVNMLTGIYIQKTQEMRKEASRFLSRFLQEQLDVVQQELDKTDFQLKSFRGTYRMGLDQETQGAVNQLNGLEAGKNTVTIDKNELNMLLGKLDPITSDFNEFSTRYVYRQIALQPIFEDDADMTIARQELNDLERARGDFLRAGLPISNPDVVELSENITIVEEKIYRLAKEKVQELDEQIAQMERQIEEVQKKLNTLPDEELRWIKLNRQMRVNEEIHGMLLKRVQEAQINEAVASENVSILDPAIPPSRPISGNKRRKAAMGLLFGLSLGVGCALVWEVTDKSIKTREDVKRYLKLPILGIIPRVKFDDYEFQDSEKAKSISSQIVTHDYSPTPVGEAYRSLRTSLLFSKNIGQIRSLIVGSVSPGEGKSFTAANLTITLAQQKSKTLIIDADLRRGVLHNTFNCRKKPGLTNYLTGVASLESVISETYIPNLSLITCGSLIPNPSELLGSMRMKRFIEGITKRFDFIVFDTPPLIAASDAVILSTLVDGVAVIIQAGRTNREEVMRKLELFQNMEARVVGVILNCAGVEVAHEGYSYYRY